MIIKVGSQELPLGDITRLTLIEHRGVKAILGRPIYDYGDFDGRDPDVQLAFVWLAFHRNDPRHTVERIPLLFEELERRQRTGEEIELLTTDEEAPVPVPPSPGDSESNANGNGPPGRPPSADAGATSGSETNPGGSGVPLSSSPSRT